MDANKMAEIIHDYLEEALTGEENPPEHPVILDYDPGDFAIRITYMGRIFDVTVKEV